MHWTRMAKTILIVVLSLFAFSIMVDVAYSAGKGREAKEKPHGIKKKEGRLPPGFSKGEKRGFIDGHPPGWSKGEKKGWRNKLPPGLGDGKSKEKIEKFNNKLKNAEAKIRERAENKKLGEKGLEKALMHLNLAARKGVPISSAQELMEQMIKHGATSDSIEKAARAYAYGVDNKTDFKGLSQFVTKKLNDGYMGDDLAIAIYNEIDGKRNNRGGD